MAIDWSDNIVLAQLTDEPMLSDELAGLTDQIRERAEHAGDAAQPEQPADKADVPSVVLDFSAVSYINSSNIAQMLGLKRVLETANRQLCLCGMSDDVWSVMMVTGLEKVFKIAPDTLTALAGLQLSETDDFGDDD